MKSKKGRSAGVNDDDLDLQEEAGPLIQHEAPKRHRFMLQFDVCVMEFASAGSEATGNRDHVRELLALGAIRQLYWFLVADGVTDEAATVADWWKDTHPLHQLGELIL